MPVTVEVDWVHGRLRCILNIPVIQMFMKDSFNAYLHESLMLDLYNSLFFVVSKHILKVLC